MNYLHRFALCRYGFAALLILVAANARATEKIELTAGIHRIEAELAYTNETRAQGLMHRTAMPPNHGMIFIFTEQARHCMWMRNTLMPLSVAFVDARGGIINIAEMQPHSEQNHCAEKPARYALEMNSGWFKSRGIKPGAAISGLQKAPQPR